MLTKEFKVQYKDAGNGSIEGYASTWIQEPDSYGDIVKFGAFTRTLQERWNGGKGIPLLWAHQMDNIDAYIGTADAEEDEKGLHFLARFDDTEQAQRVRDLYKDGRLSKFSFAYDIKDQGTVTLEDGAKANELRELDLYEISCVCVPANDDAGVIDVKAGGSKEPPVVGVIKVEMPEEMKAGKRNSAKDADAIREAITLLQGVLGELDDINDEGEDDVKANGAPEEQKQSNPDIEKLITRSKETLRRCKS